MSYIEYTSSVLNPYGVIFDSNVAHLSTLKDADDDDIFYYSYIKINGTICYGTLDTKVTWTQWLEKTCTSHPELILLRSFDIYLPQDGYILFENKSVHQISFNDFQVNLGHAIYQDATMLSYPVVIRENYTNVYHLVEDTPIDLMNELKPVFIASLKHMGSIFVQYEDGTIMGYGLKEHHSAFHGLCPDILTAGCISNTKPSMYPFFSINRHLLSYFSSVHQLEVISSNSMTTYDVSISSIHSHYILSAVESWMLFVIGDEEVLYKGELKKKSLSYVFKPFISKDHQYIETYEERVKKFFITSRKVMYIIGDQLFETDGSQVSAILADVVECYSMNYLTDELLCMDKDMNLRSTSRYYEVDDIYKPFHKSYYQAQADDFFLVILTTNTLYVLRISETLDLWRYYHVDDAFFFNTNTIAIKGNELYCTFGYCCELNTESENVLKEFDGTGSENQILHPIHRGELGDKIVKDIAVSYFDIFFLTTDGEVYTCSPIIPEKNKIHRLENSGLIQDVEICKLYNIDVTNFVLLKPCKGYDVYYYGHLANGAYDTLANGTNVRINELRVGKINSPPNMKLYELSGMMTTALFHYEKLECNYDACDIDSVIVEDDVIIFPNSTVVVVSGPSTINNSTLVIKNGTTIIIEDRLTVSNSTIVYKIPSQEVIDSIKDGDRIIIIDATNSTIEGTFDEVLIEYEDALKNDCKRIVGELEHTSNQVSIVFHVYDDCRFPVWAIILIVIGIILIATVLTLFLLKRMQVIGSSKIMQRSSTASNRQVHSNTLYEPSNSSKSNPTYAQKD